MGFFDGKVAIVTGAARGLGYDYARFFLQDGARVVMADIQGDAVEESAHALQSSGEVLAVSVDVTSPASATNMAELAVKAFGRIDILVNNAAIWGDLQKISLLEIDPGYWDAVLDVNLKGAQCLLSQQIGVEPAYLQSGPASCRRWDYLQCHRSWTYLYGSFSTPVSA